MSKWLSIKAVPVGTREKLLSIEDFKWEMTYDREPGVDFESRHWRSSDWVGGHRSTPELYRILAGVSKKEMRKRWIWNEVEGHDPYRLALVGGNTRIVEYDSRGGEEYSVRVSTTEEAADALRIMETIGGRLESGEKALQPFNHDIRAYLDFYRSVRIGEEELIYGHTS